MFALGAVVFGILLGQSDLAGYWSWLAAAVGFLVLGGLALYLRRGLAASGLVLLSLFFFFAFRAGYQRQAAPHGHIRLSLDDGQRYRIYGKIIDWPDVGERFTRLTLGVDSTAQGARVEERRGALLIHINTATHEFQYGDRLSLDGEIRSAPGAKNPGSFDYARSLGW
ncbi:MAG: DUF4131 domain-containing protein, partial [Candidatus Zixiibacteriota bacterium]